MKMSENLDELEARKSGDVFFCVSSVDYPKTPESSPPVTPQIYKVSVTPSSPTRLSSSNGGSLHGGTSQDSSRTKLLEPSITPVDPNSGNICSSRFLYVREKFRRSSLLSDNGFRTSREGKTSNQRMGNLKKDLNLNVFAEKFPPSVPPNTPSPSAWSDQLPLELTENKSEFHNDGSFFGSDNSSQVTTKALPSESENKSQLIISSDTLSKIEKLPRPILTDSNFDSNNTLNWFDHLNYLKPTKSGHTGLRSVGSSAFIKSFWGNKYQKNVHHHCFISDITDVRQMEHALLQLLEDFHSGKLRAFAKDCSMEQMQAIREQQERLARLHFDLGAQQDLFGPLTEESLRAKQENMQKLMGSLEQLSLSIEKLQLFSKDVNQ